MQTDRDLAQKYDAAIPEYLADPGAPSRRHNGHVALLQDQITAYRTARDRSTDAATRARMDANIASNERALAGLMAPVLQHAAQ